MGDIGRVAQVGVALSYERDNWSVNAKYLSNLKHNQKGQAVSLGVDYALLRKPSAVLTLNSGLVADHAARTRFAAYRAGSGLAQGMLGATLAVPLDKHRQVKGDEPDKRRGPASRGAFLFS